METVCWILAAVIALFLGSIVLGWALWLLGRGREDYD